MRNVTAVAVFVLLLAGCGREGADRHEAEKREGPKVAVAPAGEDALVSDDPAQGEIVREAIPG